VWRNLDEDTTGPVDLVPKLARELTPALSQDRSVESGFRSDVSSGSDTGAASASGHAADVEPLDHDDAVALGDVGRELVEEVSADSPLAGLEANDLSVGSLVATGAAALGHRATAPGGLLTPGLPPQTPKPLGLLRSKHRHPVGCTVGGCDAGAHAAVDADRRTGVNDLTVDLALAAKAHKPSVALTGNRQVLDLAKRTSRTPEPHPAELRDTHTAPVSVEAVDGDPLATSVLDSKRLLPFGLEAGVVSASGEEALPTSGGCPPRLRVADDERKFR
jgi:hypothetical protein